MSFVPFFFFLLFARQKKEEKENRKKKKEKHAVKIDNLYALTSVLWVKRTISELAGRLW